jgi:hypothetical protein
MIPITYELNGDFFINYGVLNFSVISCSDKLKQTNILRDMKIITQITKNINT